MPEQKNHHRLSLYPAALSSMLALTLPAIAAELPIKGSYGNKDGCDYAMTGESTGSDNFFLLTSEAVTTASAYCTFKEVHEDPDNGFTVTATCEEEGGNEKQAPFEIDIDRAGPDSYLLKIDDGSTWGPLALCR